MPDRRAAVLGARQPRHVCRRGIVDGAYAALGDRDADQHRRHRLGHRERREAMTVVARVLVALDQDRVIARDEEPGGRIALEVLMEPAALALVIVANLRLTRRSPQ